MSIKKAYAGIVEFLKVNKDKKVGTILDEVIEMCSAKSAGSSATTINRNEEGVITHIRCGYFKRWLPVSHVEFGAKSGSASGFNPMCKEGISLWTKQQREAKKAKEELLNAVASGEVPADQIQTRLDDIEVARTEVFAHPLGTETLEEALALSEADLDEMASVELEEIDEDEVA